MDPIARRTFLARTGALSLGLLGLGRLYADPARAGERGVGAGYGPLQRDPNGLLDLPAGFAYAAFSRTGEEMDDGLLVPGMHDGMAAFPGPDGLTLLVRNHEMDVAGDGPFGPRSARLGQVARELLYDAGSGVMPALGGTTTLVYDTRGGGLVRHFLSLGGTLRNCAGGPTPWGSWITCEEVVLPAGGTFERAHGYSFEVPATSEPRLHAAVPLEALGRFNHEAAAVDPRTGAVYQTEDRSDGLIYRFLPERPGELLAGGRLQALRIRDLPGASTANAGRRRTIAVGPPLAADWVDLEDVRSPGDDLRKQGHALGAATFARGEGMAYSDGAVYFTCTSGGRARKGQVWRYRPDPAAGAGGGGSLELLLEPNDPAVLENVDNLTVAPWGDLILCEDGPGTQRLLGVTPAGQVYDLAKNALNGSEFAGATFSPDGTTLFANIQTPGLTVAITGPWTVASARRPI